jgi:muramidase (phage lysozyme)
MDWAGRTNPSAPSLLRYNPTGIFYFLSYVKDWAFRPRICSVVGRLARINNAVASVTLQMLGNTWREIEYRLDILRDTNGAHVERY